MSQPFTPLSLMAAFWPAYTARSQQTSQNLTAATGAFWQGTSSFWETFTSLGRQQSSGMATLLAQTPQWQQRFATSKTPAEFAATWAAYTQFLGTTATALTTDALSQRAWLLQQWQFLGQRAQQSATSTGTTSQTHANAGTTANENFTPSYSNAASSGSYTRQPQGTFIPGPTNKTSQSTGTQTGTSTPALTPMAMPSPKAASFGATVTHTTMVPIPASVPLTSRTTTTTQATSLSPAFLTAPRQPAQQAKSPVQTKITSQPTQQHLSPLETAVLTPTSTPISTLNTSSMPAFASSTISSTSTSVSRTASTTASTTTSTAARRSVVASRRARSSRRTAIARAR